MNVTEIPVITGTLVTNAKKMRKLLGEPEIRERIETVQTTAWLS